MERLVKMHNHRQTKANVLTDVTPILTLVQGEVIGYSSIVRHRLRAPKQSDAGS